MTAYEVNFDGLVGPTHNYAGLSFGNVASMTNRRNVSHPRAAALQGLAKMKFLADLGVKQAVLPPQERPDLTMLRRVGFRGSDGEILAAAQREDPVLLAAVSSSSSMWAANAATVSAAADTRDGRVHFTAANLVSLLHRSIEASATSAMLQTIFADEKMFAHHPPLPATAHFSDEGAANQMRLSARHGDAGVEVFAFGRAAGATSVAPPNKFPARQTREASTAVARLHGLDPARTIFVQQKPDAIDAGAFHNDVVAVANENVLLYHELAFAGGDAAIATIGKSLPELHAIKVSQNSVSLDDAVTSYLFNSQLVTLPHGGMALIAPIESRENERTRKFLDELLARGSPITHVHFVDVRQSMQNGGGPACLRLRVVLTTRQLSAAHARVFFTDPLHRQLRAWIERNYREDLASEDLADPKLLHESRQALDELTRLLNLGSVYDFQRV